jgi:hypothetical protein
MAARFRRGPRPASNPPDHARAGRHGPDCFGGFPGPQGLLAGAWACDPGNGNIQATDFNDTWVLRIGPSCLGASLIASKR